MPVSIAIERNNVQVIGKGRRTLVLAHGFGCDQNMWRFLTPYLDQHHRIVLFDYTGSGRSDASEFSVERYSTLNGYAQDLIEVCESLDLQDVVLVGHSVSAMIGLIASIQVPTLFSRQIMICPSPCFLNDPPGYLGGFDREDLEELLMMMDKNYIGWANYLAPVVMGADGPAQMVAELTGSFCSTDPIIAKTFARATFMSDCRSLLPAARSKTLILQSSADTLASVAVGAYLQAQIPDSTLEIIPAVGHCLHMTRPEEVATLVRAFCEADDVAAGP